jgi:thioredoxin-dependent peroxiredoxin
VFEHDYNRDRPNLARSAGDSAGEAPPPVSRITHEKLTRRQDVAQHQLDRFSGAMQEKNRISPLGCVEAGVVLRFLESEERELERSPSSAACTINSNSQEVHMLRIVGRKLALAGLGLFAMFFFAGAVALELKVCDKAPEFSLEASDGKTYTLEQYKGKSAVVVAWFPKAFTGGCTKECKSLRENSKALKDTKIAYFTASVDTADQNTKFAKSLDLDYPILSDPDKSVAKAYGVLNATRGVSNRWTFYIDKEGIIKAIDKEIKVDKAGTDVAAKVKELGLAD